MAKIGRKPWEPTAEDLSKMEALAARGLTEEQIARSLGIHPDTLRRKKKVYAEVVEAIQTGKAKGIADIANELYQSAKEGNTTAQIFFLKCRADWVEASRLEISGLDGKPIQLTAMTDEQLLRIARQGSQKALE